MNYLFVHDALPGQFVHLIRHLRSEGHHVLAASRAGNPASLPAPSISYDLSAGIDTSRANRAEQAVALAMGLAEKLAPLKAGGYAPDVIVSHAGRGASLMLKDLFPGARLVSYLEWYQAFGGLKADSGQTIRHYLAAYIGNFATEREAMIADRLYSPTHFQAAQFPAPIRHRLQVIHDGIDTERLQPDPGATFEFEGRAFRAGDEIVTYAARGMEQTRGFPLFMQALAIVQKRRPGLQALIAAADRICYDPGTKGPGLRAWVDTHVDYDRARSHFVGLLDRQNFTRFLQVSAVHVYLSQPFVLSWSVLEAMSAGGLVLGADNEPVREVISDGENGFLVGLQEPEAVADRLERLLDKRAGFAAVRAAARRTIVDHYALDDCLARQLDLLNN